MMDKNLLRPAVIRLARTIEDNFVCFSAISILGGMILRVLLIVFTTTPNDPLNHLYPGFTDGADYMEIARSLLELGVFGYAGRPTAFRPPAYPLLISVFWKVFGETLTPIRFVQVGLYGAMTVAYSYITRKYFGPVAGLLTAVVFSVYPLFIFLTSEIATESLYMTLAGFVFVFSLILIDQKPSHKQVVLAFVLGLCCGLGTLTRSNMVFVFAVVQILIIWNVLRHRMFSRCITLSIALWAGSALVISPWLIRNHVQFGAPVLATNLDYNLFRGTFDLAGDPPVGQSFLEMFRRHKVIYEDELEDPKTLVLSHGELRNEQNARAAAVNIIQSDLNLWVKERFRNILYLWLNLQWDHRLVETQKIALLAAITVSLIYYVLLIAAVVGTFLVFRRNVVPRQKSFVIIAWFFILAAMSVIVTFVGKRYRVSMIDPYLIVLACGAAGVWLTGFVKEQGTTSK